MKIKGNARRIVSFNIGVNGYIYTLVCGHVVERTNDQTSYRAANKLYCYCEYCPVIRACTPKPLLKIFASEIVKCSL